MRTQWLRVRGAGLFRRRDLLVRLAQPFWIDLDHQRVYCGLIHLGERIVAYGAQCRFARIADVGFALLGEHFRKNLFEAAWSTRNSPVEPDDVIAEARRDRFAEI